MATGGPLDAQREQRWPPPAPEPGQPPKKTVKVEDWKPEDESDYEDLDMIMREGGWKKNEEVPVIESVAIRAEAHASGESVGVDIPGEIDACAVKD